MAANLNDGLALLHKFLVEHDVVGPMLANGTAVYLSHPRDPGPGQIDMPCVVVSLEGGEGAGATIAMVQAVVMIWAFSREGQSEAGALHHAVMEAIQRQHIRSSVTLAGGAKAVSGAVGCDFQGAIQDTWSEPLGAWARGSRWMLTVV